jgi:hypothetical protein
MRDSLDGRAQPMGVERRVLAVTIGLAVAGAASGALFGALALQVAVLIYLQRMAPFALTAPASAIGATFGAVVAPALTWAALRSAPLGRAIAGISVGAGIGAAIGVLVGAGAVDPYLPFALNSPPVPQGLAGALLGSAVAAGLLRLRYRSVPISSAPSN